MEREIKFKEWLLKKWWNWLNGPGFRVKTQREIDFVKSHSDEIKRAKDTIHDTICMHAAKKALYIFEKKYPTDKRARKATIAVEKYLKNPTQKNKADGIDALDEIFIN